MNSGESSVEVDLGVMVDGFRALVWLNAHSNEVGMGGSCPPCSAYAAALFRGQLPKEALPLRCTVAQAMQQQVYAASEVVKRRYP